MARNRKNVAQNQEAKQMTPEVAAFMERVEQLKEAGYVPLPIEEALGDAYNPNDPSWNGIINAHFNSSCCDPCNPVGKDMGRAIMSNGSEWHLVDADGANHDFISWGADNRTPNYVSSWSKMLPYTATSLKHLNELAMGCCVQPKYRFFTVTRTKAETRTIDYDAAGDLIRQRLRDAVQAKAAALTPSQGEGDPTPSQGGNNTDPSSGAISSLNAPDLLRLFDDEIAKLQRDLAVWERTQKEVHEFVANNNLPLFYLKCMQELNLLGVTLPYIVLDKQGEVTASAQWKPKAIGIEHHPVAAFRLTRRDQQGRIRNVKFSNYWLTDRLTDDSANRHIADLPMLDEQRPSADLRERLNDWRVSHRKSSTPNERPTRWVMPCIYPSDSNYYPYLAWWSIFEGEIFPYLATILSDRAIRKRNSNSVGRIVYVHTDYLERMNTEKDAKKKLAMAEEMRDKIFRATTKFLNDKSKNGSALLSYTFPDSRGNMAKAIEIVDVPYTSKSQTDADTSELADTAAIVFFALGVHPELIGAIPGAAASKGGTYLREMLLIDEVTSASVLQQLINRLFETIQAINEWDPEHLVWETPQKTLTTLDRNKSGVVEEE